MLVLYKNRHIIQAQKLPCRWRPPCQSSVLLCSICFLTPSSSVIFSYLINSSSVAFRHLSSSLPLLLPLPSHMPSSGYRDQGLPQDVWWSARSHLLKSHTVCVVWTTPKARRWSLPLWWPDTTNAWMMGKELTSEGTKCRKKEKNDGEEAAGCRMLKIFIFIFCYLAVL